MNSEQLSTLSRLSITNRANESIKERERAQHNRKNYLFMGHPNGAHAAASLYSLIETAKANGLEPYQYLRYLFEKLPYAQNEEDYKALLPQNLTAQMLAHFMSTL